MTEPTTVSVDAYRGHETDSQGVFPAAEGKHSGQKSKRLKKSHSASVRGVASVERRLSQVAKNNPIRAGIFERVYGGKASMRQRIQAFCLECNGFDTAAIRDCTAPACPLYGCRPYQKKP